MPHRYSIATVSGPLVEPVTVADVKAYAKIDDTEEDALIAGWIATARVAAENYTRRSFITRTLRLSLDLIGSGRAEWTPGYYQLPVNYFDGALDPELFLPMGPVGSVTSITTYDTLNVGTVYATSNYRLYGDRILLNPGSYWPSSLRSIGASEIIYTAGYGPAASDVPMPIRTAIAMHAALLIDTRGQCECDVPPACERLLRQYRVMDV